MSRAFALLIPLCIVAVEVLPRNANAACLEGVIDYITKPNGCREKRICNGNTWESFGCSGTVACSGCGGRTGTQTCTDACEVTGCNVGPELCNNCDDNGDGSIDNATTSYIPHTLTDTCNPNSCGISGTKTCMASGWSSCTGCGGTVPCQGCENKTGSRACLSNCSVTATGCNVGAETCNNCDDNANGQVDEDLFRNTCSSTAGCGGREKCVGGQFICQYYTGTRRACSELTDSCPQSTAECRADGTSGPCQPTSARPEDCNSCDDDLDGVVDNIPGGGAGSLFKPCSNSLGVCPGINQVCEVRPTNNGAWLDNRWTPCIAPPETCNGEDDDCDDEIDENDVCRTESSPACIQTP